MRFWPCLHILQAAREAKPRPMTQANKNSSSPMITKRLLAVSGPKLPTMQLPRQQQIFSKKLSFVPTGQFKPSQHCDTFYVLFIPKKSRVAATAPPELNIYHLMKIYVDCIEETIMANTLTQEIGTVTVPDYSGQYSYVVVNLRYVPLNKNRIETIKMECRDTEGALFPLYGGHVHAVFHLRRCQLTI